jgi:hypothetical protein
MSYIGKDPRFRSPLLTDVLATTPTSPPSGASKIVNRNAQLFMMDSNGKENPIGMGLGDKNYILSSSNPVGWVASSGAITAAIDTTVADLPRGYTTKCGIKITGVSGSTAYVYYRFTLDKADYSRQFKIKFDMNPLSGYVASDFKVDLYSNTASNYGGTSTRIATSGDVSSICALPNTTGQFEVLVTTPSSSAPYMELRIGLNAASTQAVVFSDIVVGPSSQDLITYYEEYTYSITDADIGPNSGVGTFSSTSGTLRITRVGKVVTITLDELVTTTASNVNGVVLKVGALIPSRFRPLNDKNLGTFDVGIGGSGIFWKFTAVSATGQIVLSTRDIAGLNTTIANTTYTLNFSGSYTL